MKTRLAALVAIVVAMACSAAILPVRGGTPTAAGPSFGDPAAAPPPPHAIGFPSRNRDLDALPGFASPPAGYGEVAFYRWLGDPLTKERLTWQLDLLDCGRGRIALGDWSQ